MPQKTKTIVLYNSADLDGKASARLCLRKYPGAYLHGINYGFKNFDWREIDEHTRVVMVDFCLEPWHMMEHMQEKAKEFIWIDHHKTSIAEDEKYIAAGHKKIKGMRQVGLAACELTWFHFFAAEPMPTAISLLGRYDVWDFTDSRVEPFQMGICTVSHEPSSDVWDKLLGPECVAEDTVSNILRDGEVIVRYKKLQDTLYVKMLSFPTRINPEGTNCCYKAIACNAAMNNSQLFDSIWDGNKHDLMISFHRRSDQQWSVSLYTKKDNIDCAFIASTFGGGGHQKAAGFVCSKLPFDF
jgi:oligoribonuclease NrnB/cAMP/cGMP phosphodiesterase (DHH superfamily)